MADVTIVDVNTGDTTQQSVEGIGGHLYRDEGTRALDEKYAAALKDGYNPLPFGFPDVETQRLMTLFVTFGPRVGFYYGAQRAAVEEIVPGEVELAEEKGLVTVLVHDDQEFVMPRKFQ